MDTYFDDVLHRFCTKHLNALQFWLRTDWLVYLLDAAKPCTYGLRFYKRFDPCYQTTKSSWIALL